MKEDTYEDPLQTAAMPTAAHDAKYSANGDSRSASGRLEVRCPNCHTPTQVAVDTTLTDLTCSSCGSHFSLIDETAATRAAPPLARLGRFELVARLGMGAFGAVWKAHDKQLDRTVAIKIPRASGMTAEEQEKFFREARAAAQLRHPNIVSVYEVGRDGDSVYIVSDFVRGVTLGDWLTGQKLTNREVAEVCATIADALHHAHEQGVVHRDLKPANVMIDGEGQPHLMDFGLARREVGEVTVTMDGQILGTPAYMSPEQAAGEAHLADRRSDIYSLGVILFQLLTGELPFRGNARMLMHQVIHDEPPSPRKLNANVGKDLETITLKCLEKDAAKRYQSASELATELRRFLSGEPIHARPISRIERAVRWTRRNKIVSALAACVALALLGGTIISTYFAVDARKQTNIALEREAEALAAKQDADSARRNAETRQQESEQAREEERKAKESAQAREAEIAAVLEFVENKILSAARPEGIEGGLGVDITLRQAIDAALPFVELAFAKQPLIEARLRRTLGTSFSYIGNQVVAVQQLERSHALYSQHLGSTHPDTVLITLGLAAVYHESGKHDEALKLREETLSLARANLASDHPLIAKCTYSVASSYLFFGRNEEALKLLEEAFERAKTHLKPDDVHRGAIRLDLAAAYSRVGRNEDARKLAQENFDQAKAALGADHVYTIINAVRLADIIGASGDNAHALKAYEETLPLFKAKFGYEHPTTRICMVILSNHYATAGRHFDALKLREELLALRKRTNDPQVVGTMWDLAQSYFDVGVHDGAIELYQDLALLKDKPKDADIVWKMGNIANGYAVAGRYAEAIKLQEEVLAWREANLGPEHGATLGAMSGLAWLLSTSPDDQVRDGPRARELVGKVCEIGKYTERYYLESLAAACAESGDFDSAVKWEKEALKLYDAERAPQSQTILERARSLFKSDPNRKVWLDRIALYKAKKPLRETRKFTLNKDASLAAAYGELAWTLATSADDTARDGGRALALATRACDMTDHNNPKLLNTLAAAHAEAGGFDAAIKHAEKALELIDETSEEHWRPEISRALENYKTKKPLWQNHENNGN